MNTMRVIKPPTPITLDGRPTIFLAGSIEMGNALNWQTQIEAALSDCQVTLLNPRRDEWDASWRQSINETAFRQQVEWELQGLERADIIAVYFAPETKAPITLLELGLTARSGRLLVCCPEGYWRKGNVDIVCHRYGIETVADLKELIERLKTRIRLN